VILLYTEPSLTPEERTHLEAAVREPVDCVRVPALLPASARADLLKRAFELLLMRAGIASGTDARVLLLLPDDARWYHGITQAVHARTGCWPLLVQTRDQRARLGCPGPLRIIDMDAYLMGEDARSTPPWQRRDGLPADDDARDPGGP